MPIRLLCLSLVVFISETVAQVPECDLLLRNCRLIDGTGSAPRNADVSVKDGTILNIGNGLQVDSVRTIDCAGLVVCPGFIDLHNHSDTPITKAATRAAVNYLMQGCTTIVTGNCGAGPVDAGQYYARIDEFGAGVNVAHLIPQGSLRQQIVGADAVEPTADQLTSMKELAERAMRDGTWGLSTGLIYVPGSFASTEELVELVQVVSRFKGIYASHIRGEGTGLLKSVDEALRIGREANVPVHISHFKSSGRNAWGLVREAARMIDDERRQGRQVTADQYPYIASSTSLGATLLPSSLRAGGSRKLKSRLLDPESSPAIRKVIDRAVEQKDNGNAVLISSYRPKQEWVGMTLADIAEATGRPVTDIVVEMLTAGGARIVNFSMSEDDVRHIMNFDWVATASDGRAYVPSADRPHPRNYGTFPRKLGHYAVTEKVITLESAVRSMTSLPAAIIGMKDRGILKKGMAADITVFDPATIRDNATFADPHQYCSGIEYVFVNGQPAVDRGTPTGSLAGRALRHKHSAVAAAD